MKKRNRWFLILAALAVMLLTVSCFGGIDAGGQNGGYTENDERVFSEAIEALQKFSGAVGAGDPDRQLDADVNITDRLDADGKYSTRISSYNIKSIYNQGVIGGLLINGIFQIQSDIEELNSLSEMTIFVGPDGSNFAIVNGVKTEPHTDFMFFVACTRIPEKVAEIDSSFVKSVNIEKKEDETEYTMIIDGEGLHSSPELFNLFVISAFREESEYFVVDDATYVFSLDQDGVPKTSYIRVSITAVDQEGDEAYINADVSIVFNSFENVVIELS